MVSVDRNNYIKCDDVWSVFGPSITGGSIFISNLRMDFVFLKISVIYFGFFYYFFNWIGNLHYVTLMATFKEMPPFEG